MALLLAEKVIILAKFLNFANIFSKKLSIKFLQRFNMKNHLIDLKPDKELFYRLIYQLKF